MLTLQGQHASRAQSAAFRLDRHTPLIGRTRGNATEDSACIRASSGVSYPVRRIPGDDRTARPGHRCRDWREKAPSGRTGRRADAGQPTCLRVGGSGSDMQAAPQRRHRDGERESEREKERETERRVCSGVVTGRGQTATILFLQNIFVSSATAPFHRSLRSSQPYYSVTPVPLV